MSDLPALTWAPVLLLTGLLLLALISPAAAARAAVPLAVAGALVGVPHGAVDHVVPLWWSGHGPATASAGAVLRVAALYGAAAAGAAAAVLLAPTPAVAVLLVLSAAHFGRGEVVAWAERAGRPLPGPRGDLLPAVAAGTAVVGLLLWAAPATTDPPLRRLSAPLADAVLALRPAGLAAVVVLVVLAVAALLRARRLLDAAELCLVAATFAVAPPLACFGVWFGGWHAVRHTGRLLDLAGAGPGRLRPAAARLARAGVLPTVVALLGVAALWQLRGRWGLEAEVSVLLALTVPHAVVVAALDRQRSAGAREGDGTAGGVSGGARGGGPGAGWAASR
jgi:Brp/Blh family beta-carotene 15,15'-monooxygenase